MGGMRWSSPAPSGHGRIGIVPELRATHTYDRDAHVDPGLGVEYRRGLSETWDLGGRVHTFGAGVDARKLVSRARAAETSVGIGAHFGSPPERWSAPTSGGYEVALEPAFRVGVIT